MQIRRTEATTHHDEEEDECDAAYRSWLDVYIPRGTGLGRERRALRTRADRNNELLLASLVAELRIPLSRALSRPQLRRGS